MSDETTRNLLGGQLDQLISLVRNLTDKHTETDARGERLERVLEERLYDTRPTWEAVRAQVQELGGRVGAIESATGMRAEMAEIRGEVTGMRAEIAEIRGEMTGMRAEIAEIRGEMTGMRAEIAETRGEVAVSRAEIAETRGEVAASRAEMTTMRAQSTEMLSLMIEMAKQTAEMRTENSNGFRLVARKIGVLGKTLIDMTADIRELQDRVEKIESQPT